MEAGPDRPLRVFVSHTSELARFPEKRSFVDAACAAVRRAGGIAVDMADFGAHEQRSPQVCRTEVLGCDVYLAVIGFRYGTLLPGRDDEVSYTEFEFDVASQEGKPRLVFLLDEATTTIPVALVDVNRSRINRFRQRLRDGVLTVIVTNPDDLAARVGESLATLTRERRLFWEGPRTPWMAPPLDRMVARPELGDRLIAALTEPGAAEVGLTTGLAGAGGFGKTTLAAWVCHRPEIRRRYPGGLLWVTVGQKVHGADLAEKIDDLACALSGQRSAISDPDAMGAELGRLLDEREPMLLVVDDVWDDAQLRPFRFGGRACSRLVATRIPGLLPAAGPQILVDAMSASQACTLVTDGVAGLTMAAAEQLAVVAGRWPVLLNLANGLLRRRTDRGQSPGEAAAEIMRRLAAEGPAAFDPARPSDRSRAVAATVEASLTLLDLADQDRYLDLAIFPEDVEIPIDVLRLLWPANVVDPLCEELVELGLVADYRLDTPGPRLVLHDVMRAYLCSRRSSDERANANQRLITAAGRLLTLRNGDGGLRPWWTLPPDVGYLWRHLPQHLAEAGEQDELAALVCDLRWVEAKTRRLGSAVGAVADLSLVHTATADRLRWVLEQDAPLLSLIDPPEALGATLASRLHKVPGLETVLDRYCTTLPRPRLEPTWPLPDRPDTTESGPAGHSGAITSCAFSPDGTLLATSSDDGTARLWHVADGTERAVLTGHAGGVWDCAFSPDGTLLATASDDCTARLWNLSDGSLHTVLSGHTEWVQRCTFSPDGTLLATASSDRTARLWKIADGVEHTVLVGHTSAVTGCAFSPAGALLATSSDDGTARLWKVTDATQHWILAGHSRGVRGCVFSPDGELLATGGDDGTARLWTVSEGAERTVLTGHASGVWACAFSPDGALLATATGIEGTVRLWHVKSGITQAVLTGHWGWIRGCAFSPDSTMLATAGNDQTLRLWRVPDGTPQAVLVDPARVVTGCAFSPDGALLATTSYDRTVRLWRVPDGTPQAVLTGHSSAILRCAFSPDGALLATTSRDRTVRLWRVPDGTPQAVLTGHTGGVRRCAFSPDGALLATASRDRTVRLWRIPGGAVLAVLTGHISEVNACAFSPDGALLATASSDQTTRVWRVADGVEQAILTGHVDVVNSCAFSPDSRLLATVSDDRTIRLWRMPDGVPQGILHGHASWVEACAFSPDGALLATASRDRTVRLWEVATGRCHCALRVASLNTSIAWHPHGRLLCAVGGVGIYLLTYVP